MTEPKFYSLEELQELAWEWQHAVGLLDWTLIVEFDRGFNLGAALGRIQINEDRKLAHIRLLTTGDYSPAPLDPYDMEETLLHEILHIHFWPLTREQEGNTLGEEQAINAWVKSLMTMKRRIGYLEQERMELMYPEPGTVHVLMAGRGEQGPYG